MKILALVVVVFLSAILFCGCVTSKPPPTSAFVNDWTGLFLSVTKSYGIVRTYYLGSDDKWSYFESIGDTPKYRKVETSSMNLQSIFPFPQGKPYRIQLADFQGNHHP